MLNYTGWNFCNETIYVKECIENSIFDIVIEPCAEGYEPRFYDKNMWKIYRKYNPVYYIGNSFDDVSVVLKFMEEFIDKYNKLLVFM